MASTTSPEASEIRRRGRRRLLGAVTLVLLAVVFIPMILDSEPRPQRTEPSLKIPPKENIAPLPAPSPAAAPVSSSPAPAPVPSSPAPVPVPSSPAPVPVPSSRTPQGGDGPGPNASAKPGPAPAKVEPVAKAPAPAPKLEGFAVQVGAFRDEARLHEAKAKLDAARIAHYTERIDAKGGAMTRLRAGPFPTREDAEKARARLQEGQVVALP